MTSGGTVYHKDGKKYFYKRPTHSCLARGKSVQAAGECIFVKENDKWSLIYITNGSGHYRPDAFKTLPLAVKIFQTTFTVPGNNRSPPKLILRNTITPNITFTTSHFSPSYNDLWSNNVDKDGVFDDASISVSGASTVYLEKTKKFWVWSFFKHDDTATVKDTLENDETIPMSPYGIHQEV